jgi:hypothetical protein
VPHQNPSNNVCYRISEITSLANYLDNSKTWWPYEQRGAVSARTLSACPVHAYEHNVTTTPIPNGELEVFSGAPSDGHASF